MNFKNLVGAFAIAAAGFLAAAPASHAVSTITDHNGDSTAFPFAGTLTLDPSAALTGGFDATSRFFNWSGTGSSSVSFSVATTKPMVVEFGNLVTPKQYTTADLTIDGTTIDLLTLGNTFLTLTVSNPFTVTTNFVSATGAGTFDFQISAVPLPAGLLLLFSGLGGLALVGRRRLIAA